MGRAGIHGKTFRNRSDESFELLLVIPFAIFNPGSEQGERGGHLKKWDGKGTKMRLSAQKVLELALITRLFSQRCMSEVDSRVGYRNTDT